MSIINTNERLQLPEMSHGTEVRDMLLDTHLTYAGVEHLFKRRKEMLSSIKADIEATLYEALCAKVDYENNSLLKIIESDAKIVDARKRLNKVLKAEYFVQKPLDADIL